MTPFSPASSPHVEWCFLDQLERFGPDQHESVPPAEAERYCSWLAATHYENFHVVTRLTPRALRPAFAAIYSYCRWSDDLGDEVGDRARARELLAWWRGELEALYAGRARHPVMVALDPVRKAFAIPIGPFADLISAFEQDQEVLEYETYDQLVDYCSRSANPVGRLVLYLFRCHDEERGQLSDATCTALQLTNFWQDVVPDLVDRQRIYLPREDLDRFDVPRRDLVERRYTDAFRRLLRFQVERARTLFHAGWPLIARVPRAVAVDVDLFTRGGLAILDLIERQNYDVLTARPSLGKSAKARLLARALLARVWPGSPRAPGLRRSNATASGMEASAR